MVWETFPHSYTSPHIHSWIFKTLWVIIFWVRVTCKMLNVNCIKIHSIILSITCHGWETFPHSYTSPQNHSWIFETLQVISFWVRVTHKILNVNCIKIHSIILYVTCDGLINFLPYSYTSSWNHSWIFDSLRVIIFWVRVTHKMLNVNCMKIHSIILSVTCHGLGNFLPLIHIPSKPFMNFWNPMGGVGHTYMRGGGAHTWGGVGHAGKQPKNW